MTTRWKSSLILLLVSVLNSHAALAEERRVGVGLGVLTLAKYVDIQFLYQPDSQRHWMYVFRYLGGTDTFNDPFTGNALTDDEETLFGPTAYY